MAALLLLYPLAALIGGAVPVNRGYAPPADGAPFWICSNGIHTDFVLPAAGGSIEWAGVLPRAAFAIAPTAEDYIGFGWGDRQFYLETEHWSDLRPSTALAALFGGGPTVVHVQVRPRPDGNPGCRRILADRARIAAIEDYILATMVRTPDGQPIAAGHAGYGLHDGFVQALGRYSLIATCNDWVRRGLAEAGIRTALWSPFPYPLLWHGEGLGG